MLADHVHVRLRDGGELAPQHVERVAVQPACASLEPRRVDEVRRADLRDVHLQRGMLAHESAGCPRVIQVDVAQQQMADVHEPQAVGASPAFSASMVVLGPQSKRAGPSSVSRR